MKKTGRFLVPILALNSIVLFGCKNEEKDNHVLLTYGDLHSSEKNIRDFSNNYEYELTYSDLKLKIEQKSENFMLAIANQGCACWSNLSSVVSQYTKETNTICYRVLNTDFEGKDFLGLDVYTSDSTFAIIENGQIQYSLNTASNKKETENYSNFKEFMDKTVKLPKMYYADRDDIESIILDPHASSTVYFSRNKCGDCKHVEPYILKPYFESHQDSKNLYILDCQYFWKSQEDPDFQDYLDEKDALYLAEESNPKFGYGAGVFPSFMYFDNCEVKAGAVAYNDEITKEGSKYIVSNSYYTNERKANLPYLTNFTGTCVIKGMEIPENEITAYGSWSQEKADKYYQPLINAFLDYSLNLSNNYLDK